MRRIILFSIAGTLGFIVDAGIAETLILELDVNFYLARVVSFFCAVATTYVFNHRYTFSDKINGRYPGLRRRYLVAMIGGFCLNYGTYALLGFRFPEFFQQRYPILAILAGSFAGMSINYLSSHYWVFRPSKMG